MHIADWVRGLPEMWMLPEKDRVCHTTIQKKREEVYLNLGAIILSSLFARCTFYDLLLNV